MTTGAGVLDLEQLLRVAVDDGASDIHVKVGSRPHLRVDGVLREAPFETVEPADTERIVQAILPAPRAEQFQLGHEAHFTYGIVGLARFRVSVFRQRGWLGLVLRRVMPGIPGFEALSLPPAVASLAEQSHGLVLVTGLAASGKTATLAAMVDHVNVHRSCHIVTIEDPIEVLHADKLSIVDQREIGGDAVSYASAIAEAMHQDPDVVMVAQLDGPAAAEAALRAAEAGHLVLASLASVGAVETVERFVNMFAPHEQVPVRTALAGVLRGIVAQRLLPRARGRGRVPAVELLVTNARVAERVADASRVRELEHEMTQGDLYGMQTFDQSLVELYRQGLVARPDAIRAASHMAETGLALDRVDADRGLNGPRPVPASVR